MTHRPFWERGRVSDRVYVYTALVPTIIDTLRSAGIEPVIKQVGELPATFGADQSVIGGLHAPWDGFAEVIDTNVEGVIRVSGTRALVECLVTFCRMYPEKKILILAASQSTCRWLAWRLHAAIGELVETGIKAQPARERVVVSPYRGPLNPREFTMVIAAYGHELGGDKAYDRLLYIFTEVRRRYVFEHDRPRLAPQERDTARALFGSTIWTAMAPVKTPVRVCYCDAFGPAPVSRDQGLECKRTQIWHNAERNQVIARAAQAMIDRDIRRLWELGLFLEHERFPETVASTVWSVAIVVENTEHASELSRLMPGWPVKRSGPDDAPGDDRQTGAGMIMTTTRAAESGVDCPVMLWAGGGSPPSITGFPPPGVSMGIVVDFAGAGEDGDDLRRRIRKYFGRGWEVEDRVLRAGAEPETIQSRVAGAGDNESLRHPNRHVVAGSASGRDPTSVNTGRHKGGTAPRRKHADHHRRSKSGRKDFFRMETPNGR